MKYWISELSFEAMQIVRKKAVAFYTSQDIKGVQLCELIKDISNEKLGNLDAFLTYEEMQYLSDLK